MNFDAEACVLLVYAVLTENIVISEPLVDLLDFRHPAESEFE